MPKTPTKKKPSQGVQGYISDIIFDVDPDMFCIVIEYIYGGSMIDVDWQNDARAIIDASDK
jgi:hypothetical protein